MNRKAKRNKYKKLTSEYIILKKDFDNFKEFKAFQENCNKREVTTISAMLIDNSFLNSQCILPEDTVKELREKEMIKNLCENLISNMQLFRTTKTEIGIKYDLQIVIPKDL